VLCCAALRCAVLDDLGVQYWADFGTLLGMYREVRQSNVDECVSISVCVRGRTGGTAAGCPGGRGVDSVVDSGS
jgi:hypothetical protein